MSAIFGYYVINALSIILSSYDIVYEYMLK